MKTVGLVLATLILSSPLIIGCGTSDKPSSGGSGGGGNAPTGGSAGKASGGSGGAGNGGGAGSGGGANTAGTTSQSDAAASGGAGGGSAGQTGSADMGGGETGGGEAGGKPLEFPMLKVLPLFTAPDVPVRGPKESNDINLSTKGSTPPTGLPGKGIAQHPMIYFGESYRRILVVIDGKVAWHYDTVDSWEIDDIWMLSNGNVLFAHMGYIEEVTPKKELVFHIDAQGEIHTCQPIGLDKVLYVQSQAPKAHVKLYNKTTKTFEIDQEIDSGPNVHVQCRRFRKTGRGTYIAAYLDAGPTYNGGGRVAELDKDFKELYTFTPPAPNDGKNFRPWSAVPLKNGNVLIQSEVGTDEGGRTLEVNLQKGEIVWQVTKNAVLPAGMKMQNTQTCEHLYTGNIVIFGNGGINAGNVQALEVTPEKKVVWVLQDWQNLGDATSAQFLDEPGYPEIPGDTTH